VRVKVGDKVSEGSVLLVLDTQEQPTERPKGEQPAAAAPPQPRPSPAREEQRGAPAPAQARPERSPFEYDVLVLGSGPGGYSAAFRAADLGKRVVLVERYKALGGVCLNVGCIPSKALLHVAGLMDEARGLAAHGVSFGEARVEVEKLRAWKDKVVGRLSGGVSMMAKGRNVEVVTGEGKFTGAHELAVAGRTLRFDKAIIAAGSQSAKLPFSPDDPRIVDSTGALELRAVPQRMLVIGGGIIGMEMASVYSTLGSRIDVVEMLDGLMTGADRDLVKVWQKRNASRFDRLMLKTKSVGAEAARDGIHVRFDNADPAIYDLVLVSVGRVPNGKRIGAEAAGVRVDERGYIPTDKQMRTNVEHIFAIGDIAGPPMLAHKATHEAKVAAEVAAGHKSSFDARCIPSVAYTDPEIAWAGLTETEAKAGGVEYGKGMFPWAASGRSLALNRDEGFTKLLFDKNTHRVIGGGIVGSNAGELIAEVALAIEMGADAADIGLTVHAHPTLSETVAFSAEAFEGTLTDLYTPKK
jgi:dihydrolipoamide dehydrogenase